MVDVTTISTKGQIVIPAHIREELGLHEGNQVVISKVKDFVVLKKITIRDPTEEFENLTREGIKHAKKLGLKSEEDVVRLIHKIKKDKVS
jgi:antitoxin PrlF